MDTAWRREQDHLEPIVYKLEFRVFSDGLERSSDTGASPATADDATATDHRTATAATAAAEPGPGHISDRHGPTAAPPASSPAGDAAASPSSPAVADGFPRFLDLPPELRLRVWEELLQPRIIMVACCPASPASHPRRLVKMAQLRARPRRRLHFSPAAPTPSAVPVLLHACRESRALALRHYQPAFAWRAPLPTVPAPGDYDGERRAGGPARVYFNFRLDALYLMGELDREDEFGFVGSPLAYYLDRADAARVRHVVVALEELLPPRAPPTPPPLTLTDGNAAAAVGGFGGFGGGGGGGVVGGDERVFSSLFHVVDRFSAAERLLVACTARDVEEEQHSSSWSPPLLSSLPGEDNVVQKIWRGWLGGTSVVSSTLLDKKILMVREEELQDFIRAHL